MMNEVLMFQEYFGFPANDPNVPLLMPTMPCSFVIAALQKFIQKLHYSCYIRTFLYFEIIKGMIDAVSASGQQSIYSIINARHTLIAFF